MPEIHIKHRLSSICEEKYWNINAKSPVNRISTVSYNQARIQGFEKRGANAPSYSSGVRLSVRAKRRNFAENDF